MKPATRLTFIVVTLIALLHLLRLIVGVNVTVGAALIPAWFSVVAMLFFTALGIGLWREHSGRPPAA
jgi:hypothetical protein